MYVLSDGLERKGAKNAEVDRRDVDELRRRKELAKLRRRRRIVANAREALSEDERRKDELCTMPL